MRDTGERAGVGETDTQREERWGNGAAGQREEEVAPPPPTPDVLSQLPGAEGWAPCPCARLQGKKRQTMWPRDHDQPRSQLPSGPEGSKWGGGHTPLGTGLLRGMLPHRQESPLQSWATGLNLSSPTVRTVKSRRDF